MRLDDNLSQLGRCAGEYRKKQKNGEEALVFMVEGEVAHGLRRLKQRGDGRW